MMPAQVESVAAWLGRGVEMPGPAIVPIVVLPIVAETVIYSYSPLSLAGLAWLPLDAGALQQGGLAVVDRATRHGLLVQRRPSLAVITVPFGSPHRPYVVVVLRLARDGAVRASCLPMRVGHTVAFGGLALGAIGWVVLGGGEWGTRAMFAIAACGVFALPLLLGWARSRAIVNLLSADPPSAPPGDTP